jgi:hypothetical protein
MRNRQSSRYPVGAILWEEATHEAFPAKLGRFVVCYADWRKVADASNVAKTWNDLVSGHLMSVLEIGYLGGSNIRWIPAPAAAGYTSASESQKTK